MPLGGLAPKCQLAGTGAHNELVLQCNWMRVESRRELIKPIRDTGARIIPHTVALGDAMARRVDPVIAKTLFGTGKTTRLVAGHDRMQASKSIASEPS